MKLRRVRGPFKTLQRPPSETLQKPSGSGGSVAENESLEFWAIKSRFRSLEVPTKESENCCNFKEMPSVLSLKLCSCICNLAHCLGSRGSDGPLPLEDTAICISYFKTNLWRRSNSESAIQSFSAQDRPDIFGSCSPCASTELVGEFFREILREVQQDFCKIFCGPGGQFIAFCVRKFVPQTTDSVDSMNSCKHTAMQLQNVLLSSLSWPLISKKKGMSWRNFSHATSLCITTLRLPLMGVYPVFADASLISSKY